MARQRRRGRGRSGGAATRTAWYNFPQLPKAAVCALGAAESMATSAAINGATGNKTSASDYWFAAGIGCATGGNGGGNGGSGGKGDDLGSRIKRLANVGRAGKGSNVREVVGTSADAERMIQETIDGIEGVVVRPHPNPAIPGGYTIDLPGGGTISYRPTSKSGPPTIDVHNVPGFTDFKIKFVPK